MAECKHGFPYHQQDETAHITDTLDLVGQNLSKLVLENPPDTLCVITRLCLDYNDISCLPVDFAASLQHLEFFSANGNNLSELPEQFGSLKGLQEVHLSENSLTHLPDSVQNLVNLRVLKLTGNKLLCLPVDLGEAEALEELSVEENELTRFPPTFALLTNLRLLEAGHNKIGVLPKYLGNLKSLTHIDLCNNMLEEIPESFGELQNLVCVDVSRNHLKALPERCVSQKTLKKFYSGQNVIDHFPEWLGHLPELTTLCMKENSLTGSCLPADIGKVSKKLQHLNLCGNHLTELPESFGELENLEFLHLGSMLDELERKDWVNGNWLQKLPTSFPQLHTLTMLRLDENQIQFLPDDFGLLRSLEFFNIGQNLLYDLPESFGQLTKLRVCLLSRNNIQLLPSTFGSLTALQELRVDNNQLAELPASFRDLTQLKVLDLFHNCLSKVPSCLSHLNHLQFLDLNQNPISIPKRLIPSITKNNEYAPRDPKLKGTWRGRLRDKMEDFVDMTVNNIAVRGLIDDDAFEDEVNEEVDELYSEEDIPYNYNALQIAAERSMWGQSTWRSHSGPDCRPLFVRQAASVPVQEIIGSLSENGEGTEDNDSYMAPEQSPNSMSENMMGTRSRQSSGAASDWQQDSAGQSLKKRGTTAAEENWDSGPVPLEENWDEELIDPTAPMGYSVQDFCNFPRNGFAYNPALRGFFFEPSDLHASSTPRPHRITSDDCQPPPAPETSQFSDADDS